MDHDVRSLQVFMEARFDALDDRAERMHHENRAELVDIKTQVTATNGRLRRAEVAIAVLKFAVFTIVGGLVYSGLQIVIDRVAGR